MQPHMSCSEGSGPEVSDTTPNDLPELQARPMPILAELLCSEPPDEVMPGSVEVDDDEEDDQNASFSHFDSALLNHSQIMERMKFLENQVQKYDYFNGAKEVLPYMRKVVASWMLEVCEEQSCDEAVFPMAIAILDRLLLTCNIKKEQLQLVACVCLLISSKSRQCSHFSLELLSWYTDNSVTPDTMRSWELMILAQLNWDINIITPIDFVDLLLVRSLGPKCHASKETQLVRRHAITFIALCCTESRFVGLNPSSISASAIYTALKGVHMDSLDIARKLAENSWKTLEQLNSITSSIEQVIATEMAAIQQTVDTPIMNKNPNLMCSQQQQLQQQQQHPSKVISSTSSSASGQNTPTDVQDIVI